MAASLGAVVNQASRVEGITKVLQIPILVTREVAEKVSPATAVPVCMGRYRPAGMNADIELYELTTPPGNPKRAETLGLGLAAFQKGDWEAACRLFDSLPAGDGPGAYLLSVAELCRRNPPKAWRGVIELSQK